MNNRTVCRWPGISAGLRSGLSLTGRRTSLSPARRPLELFIA
jgi:hypothetical protein